MWDKQINKTLRSLEDQIAESRERINDPNLDEEQRGKLHFCLLDLIIRRDNLLHKIDERVTEEDLL